jgi:hypothetical protein
MGIYRYVNALSLDVALGSVISSLFFAKLLGVTLSFISMVTLALAVWAIYTLDHLWDVYKSQNQLRSFRHQFHRRHFNLLLVLVGITIIAGIVLLNFVPVATRDLGLFLTVVVLGYFVILRIGKGKMYYKEILVCVVYTFGILLAPLSLLPHGHGLDTLFYLVIIQFSFLAFSKLVLFAYYEAEVDQQQGFRSLAVSIGKPMVRSTVIAVLSLVCMGSAISGIFWLDQELIKISQPIVLLMAISLFAIAIWPRFFNKGDGYRFIGDGIFIIPVLVL